MSCSETVEHIKGSVAECANCKTELLGPHCYSCGQPVKGMVRQFSNIIGDFFDTLLALDSRIVRTLAPLLFRPGFLTVEYFAGRRVRYVSPVRLFIFLCITTFFTIQLSTDWKDYSSENDETVVEEVSDIKQPLDEVRNTISDTSNQDVETEFLPNEAPKKKVGEMIDEFQRAEPKLVVDIFDSEDDDHCNVKVGGACWDNKAERPRFSGVPQSLVDSVAEFLLKIEKNSDLVEADPNRFKKIFLGSLPSTLFIMLPIFALMLWVLYLFKRRLYMEHLIVALHSHAFISLALLLTTLLLNVQGWFGGYPWVEQITWCLISILLFWMPVYLLIMQKRLYRQGWIMTLIKYSFLAVVYPLMLSIGATLAVLYSVAEF
ncbi:DUF3667 domain-containing protein [Microbulbifer sp. VAAC004]|uniref:DUF3667 domain-containing protein n=1 Tax=unclassified Microbulbifer TaxID=2619833 RepID=UPI0040398BD4